VTRARGLFTVVSDGFCVRVYAESCLSWVPEKGTVGASGDLAPLAHLALGMIGEGQMWSPETGWGDAKQVSSVYLSI